MGPLQNAEHSHETASAADHEASTELLAGCYFDPYFVGSDAALAPIEEQCGHPLGVGAECMGPAGHTGDHRPPLPSRDETCGHCNAAVQENGQAWRLEIGLWFCPECKDGYWH